MEQGLGGGGEGTGDTAKHVSRDSGYHSLQPQWASRQLFPLTIGSGKAWSLEESWVSCCRWQGRRRGLGDEKG